MDAIGLAHSAGRSDGGAGREAAIPDSILIEYDGAPHGLLASHPQQRAADVLAFVRGTDARATTPIAIEPEVPLLYPIEPSIA